MTTRPGSGVNAAAPGTVAQRTIERRPGLPGSRAIVGGLLIALAGVLTFAAWQQASAGADQTYAVAARTIRPGDALSAADIRLEPMSLPAGMSAAAFTDAAELDGRVALGPIGEGELLQSAQVSDRGQGSGAAELSFSIARDRAVDGRLGSGDLVDVFVTDEERTRVVAAAMPIIAVGETGAGGFGPTTELTITLAITDPALPEALIHAVREGEVTLVRSTHQAGPAGPPVSP